MRLRALGLLLFVVGSVGCAPVAGAEGDPPSETFNQSYLRTIKLVRLSDGTRCAVYSNGYQGGLSCDWRLPDPQNTKDGR